MRSRSRRTPLRPPTKVKALIPTPIADLHLSSDWGRHIDAVRPAILRLDHLDAVSVVMAPSIAVSNATR